MNTENLHNKYAPYWAAALVLLMAAGLSTIWLKPGGIWNSYVLDICGPAWTYILIRGLFTSKSDNAWTRFFNPLRSFLVIVLAAFGIEIIQYFGLYESTFDPWDFPAYLLILLPLFLRDRKIAKLDLNN